MKACHVNAPRANPQRKAEHFRQKKLECLIRKIVVSVVVAFIVAVLVAKAATDAAHSKYVLVQNHLIFMVAVFGVIVLDIEYGYPYCKFCLGLQA